MTSSNSPSAKPRRFLRFSLRTMLLMVAVCAVLLGVHVKRTRQQQQAVAALLAVDSTGKSPFVKYDFAFDPSGKASPNAESPVK